jgi:hypothetical protein
LKIILKRLQEKITEKGLLHETQRGFRQSKSTLHNIKDFLDLIKLAKAQAGKTDSDKRRAT